MIRLKRGEIGEAVITASEKTVLPNTAYTITFTHDLTKAQVVITDAPDVSIHPDRYNAFEIDTALFATLDSGFYTYQVTDQDSNLLEVGKMKLEGDKPVITQYQDTPTEYATYGD
jgi:hypothetical protein